MRFHQVRELVHWAADYHGQLAEHYGQRAKGKVSERVRMALEYLANHERTLQANLEVYFDDGSDHRGVLDTWFDDPADFPHLPVLDRLPESMSCDSVQDVLATALTAHKTLQDLYRHRADRASIEEEREFFSALAEGHDGEVRRLARDIQRLEDY
ncbi:2-hydroxyacyl-CoA dehydratase [Halomonas sp. YLGW01]|uniref:2-hydroxyacyl-CoA dehydratase n=1 Tax=Halomonas sp. YLGW01 TaxID=2773308 RepID=UPI0017862FB4|nr:2-hydroxyacyl-CoA dehydratase [Halomonas sp. YLGW01]